MKSLVRHLRTCVAALAFTPAIAGLVATEDALVSVDLSVVDEATGKPIACRIHLKAVAGRHVAPDKLPFWRDHFVCPGTVSLKLSAGKYVYQIEHGPEYAMASGDFTIARGARQIEIKLKRLADMACEGWWSGELHVHRPVADIELLMQAEDLHVAPVITWWHNRKGYKTLWDGKELPKNPLLHFDGNRYAYILAGEDERQGGALLYFNLPRPLALMGATLEYPPAAKFLAESETLDDVWIDIEKPFWWDVPIWLACGRIDSIGLANNHMQRSGMYETEAWGKSRDEKRLPAPRGTGFWTQELYYHILNSGLRIPPSAGSASGVLNNPVGYNRMYVHLDGKFDYKAWWQSLRQGRVFVTNGPLLRVRVNGQLPGQVFSAAPGKVLELDVKVALTTRDEIETVEIVQNGRVERAVPYADVIKNGTLGKLRMDKSGWFLVRAIAKNTNTFRFASTGPYYVEIGEPKRRIDKASAQFFLDWVQERTRTLQVEDAAQRGEVLKYHERARKFWQDKVTEAGRQ